MKATNYRRVNGGALVGTVDLEMSSGLILVGCTIFNSNGRVWVAPASKPVLNKDGTHALDDHGKKRYANIVEFDSKETRSKFTKAALSALKELGVDPAKHGDRATGGGDGNAF